MQIGIVLPTRGLVYAQVEEAIERERKGKDIRVYRSHNLPIPDGHNQLTKQALEDGCELIWFIEEDTVPFSGALDRLIQTNNSVACIDYGVSGWGCVTKTPQGEILWCGLGCTLVKKEVFEKLEYPYFRTDKTLRLNDWKWVDLPKDYQEGKQYGSLDIWFFTKVREQGFDIVQVEGECQHLELLNLGERGKNNGLHTIKARPEISKNQVI